MKNEKIEKPQVIVDLPVILHAWCMFAFESTTKDDSIYAPRSSKIGRAIIGYISKSNFKPVLPEPRNPVTFIVPETKNNWYSLKTKYLYFTSEDNEAFVARVATEFDNWAELMFKDGYAMNLDQFDIIESILDILNVRMNAANFEQIKKNDYRERKNEVRKRSKALLMQRKLAV